MGRDARWLDAASEAELRASATARASQAAGPGPASEPVIGATRDVPDRASGRPARPGRAWRVDDGGAGGAASGDDDPPTGGEARDVDAVVDLDHVPSPTTDRRAGDRQRLGSAVDDDLAGCRSRAVAGPERGA